MESKTNENDSLRQSVRIAVGIFGFVAFDPLPAMPEEVWKLVEENSHYHSGDEKDQELAAQMGFPYMTKNDLAGYYYSDKAMSAMMEAGIRFSYLGYTLKSLDEVARINKEFDEIADEQIRAAKEKGHKPDN